MAAQFVVKDKDEILGPFTGMQLRAMAASGKLVADSLLRKLPDGKWVRAANAKGLWPQTSSESADDDQPEVDPLVSAASRALSAAASAGMAATGSLSGAVRGLIKRQPEQEGQQQRRLAPSTSLFAKLTSEEQDPAIVGQVIEKVESILMAAESLLYIAVQCKPILNFAPDCAVLTDQRLIFYRPKLLGRVDFHDYPWIDLSDARLQENIIGSTFSMRLVNGRSLSMDYLPKAQARQLYRYAQEREMASRELRRQRTMEESRAAAGGIVVQNAIGQMPNPTAPAPTEDPMTALSKLKGLLDAGLITQTDFDSKKKEILSRL